MTGLADKTRRELKAIRDTVESIWVAIVLAFVLRAFMIEAFVIPTGSMAPRLMGEHWDLTCEVCGHRYAYGLRREVPYGQEVNRNEKAPPNPQAQCPNCGSKYRRAAYVNGGDRVLVLKYLYRFREPEPWDVVVFRNPQNNRENYIKRLIGLPGETIEIIHGDVFVKTSPEAPWKIRRKTRRAQQAMWQVVFHNDHRPSQALVDSRDAPHWQAEHAAWDLRGDHGRRFDFSGSNQPAFLRLEADRTHFWPRYGYNAPNSTNGPVDAEIDVCSDLKLSFVFTPQRDDAKVALHLTSFQHRFKGEIHRDGTVALYHKSDGASGGDWPEPWARAKLKPFALGRGHRVALSHVDFRVQLRVDGEIVLESTDAQYDADHEDLRARATIRWALSETEQQIEQAAGRLRQLEADRRTEPSQQQEIENLTQQKLRLEARKARQEENLKRWLPFPQPQIRISARGGPCDLRHVSLSRDVYYTASNLEDQPPGPLGRYAQTIRDRPKYRSRNRWMLRPGSTVKYIGWGVAPNSLTLRRHETDRDLDEFFVLGDNSPQSLDGRAWIKAAPSLRLFDKEGKSQYQLGTVPRYNLIGKAFFVYWPAGFRLPGLPGLSIIPNLGKMRMIR